MAEIRKIPPVTRFLTGSSLVISIPVLMNIVPRYMIVFFPKLVFRELEVSLAFEAICIVSTNNFRCGDSIPASSLVVSETHSN